jgi:hypothetical protein
MRSSFDRVGGSDATELLSGCVNVGVSLSVPQVYAVVSGGATFGRVVVWDSLVSSYCVMIRCLVVGAVNWLVWVVVGCVSVLFEVSQSSSDVFWCS